VRPNASRVCLKNSTFSDVGSSLSGQRATCHSVGQTSSPCGSGRQDQHSHIYNMGPATLRTCNSRMCLKQNTAETVTSPTPIWQLPPPAAKPSRQVTMYNAAAAAPADLPSQLMHATGWRVLLRDNNNHPNFKVPAT
jgi:hypothetical protein